MRKQMSATRLFTPPFFQFLFEAERKINVSMFVPVRFVCHVGDTIFHAFLLSHTLMELFFEATWGTLTRSGMERLGSFPSALARDSLS